ncbi:MAG: cell division protein FtsL [Treponema sp.]|jgi:cell division protein FtsL|nr:cell division protein FtsL [Treponema sp.]
MKKLFFYFMVLTIPLLLGLVSWQSARYGDLERELERLEKSQQEWAENNKRLIAGISLLSSPDRIEHIARDELGMEKKRPEDVLLIHIAGGKKE